MQDLVDKAMAAKYGFEAQHAEVLGLVLNRVRLPLTAFFCVPVTLMAWLISHRR